MNSLSSIRQVEQFNIVPSWTNSHGHFPSKVNKQTKNKICLHCLAQPLSAHWHISLWLAAFKTVFVFLFRVHHLSLSNVHVNISFSDGDLSWAICFIEWPFRHDPQTNLISVSLIQAEHIPRVKTPDSNLTNVSFTVRHWC